MSFIICSKNVMNVAFLSNKKNIYIYIYSDSKNEDIVKILWYFIVFLNFFFNIIKLDKPKFTISHTKSILIFSLLEAACAANASLYNKSVNVRTVLRYCASNVFHCTYTVVVTLFWFRESLFFFLHSIIGLCFFFLLNIDVS